MRAASPIVWAVCLAAPLCAGGARADEPVPAPDATREEDARRAQDLTYEVQRAYQEGRFADALPLAREALARTERALGPNSILVGSCLVNVATLLQALGRAEEAIPLYRRAVALHVSWFGEAHPGTAAVLGHLGSALRDVGAYADARSALERAVASTEKTQGPGTLATGRVLLLYAWLLRDLGQDRAALPLLERAVAIHERVLGPEQRRTVEAVNNLALTYLDLGEPERGVALLEKAVGAHERVTAPEHADTASLWNNLGVALMRVGRREAAIEAYDRALGILDRSLGPDHPDFARTLANSVSPLLDLGRADEGEERMRRALRVTQAAFGPEHPSTLLTRSDLATLAARRGRWDDARALWAESLAGLERFVRRSFGALSEGERATLIHSMRANLDAWLAHGRELGTTGYAEVLRFRGLATRATEAERRLLRRGDAAAAGLRAELVASERRLARLAGEAPAARNRDAFERWRTAVAAEGAERDRLAARLAAEVAVVREAAERSHAGVEDVASRLGVTEALVDVLCTRGAYVAWVVRRGRPVVRVDLGPIAAIDDAAAAFRAETSRPDGEAEMLFAAGVAFRRLFVDPLRPHLGEATTDVRLCPDGALAAVPFAAVPMDASGAPLGDALCVHLVADAQELAPGPAPTAPGTGALVVGAVDFDAAAGATASRPGPVAQGSEPAGWTARRRTFPPLPGTGEEAAAVARILGEETEVVTGADATEARLRRASARRRVVHVAAHGFVDDDPASRRPRREGGEWLGAGVERRIALGQDPMSLAGLALAGASARAGGGGDDGVLTALEASWLDLDGCELVVLSACETGLGKAEAGEGVLGLVRGFRLAGARRVLASLWKVSDDATRVLMEAFYEALQGTATDPPVGAAEALRRAQARVRATPQWRHPAYWAAWALWGD